ncbi:MAG: PH domain-containing protein [Anaerolineae bacterium]|nr:PH domain-containing protein [Anaerolineae bacterium]
MKAQFPQLPQPSRPPGESDLPVPAEERTYLALSPDRTLYNSRAAALAAAWASLSLAVAGLALAGVVSPLAGLTTFLLLAVLGTVAMLIAARSSAAPRLEIMPGVARYAGGHWRHRETIVHYDRVAAASIVQGPFERFVSRTATLELTLACGSGLVKLKVSGLTDASAQRDSVLSVAGTASLTETEWEQVSLARRTVSVLEEVNEELSRMRSRLERL